MPNVIAIKKAEELLQQLLADDGSTASQAALARQAEDVRMALQQPPDVANFYIKKVGRLCGLMISLAVPG